MAIVPARNRLRLAHRVARRPTPIVTPEPTPAQLQGLEFQWSGLNQLDIFAEEAANASTYEFVFREVGTEEFSPSVELTEILRGALDFEDSTHQEGKGRGVSPNGLVKGAYSALATFTTYTPLWTPRDAKFFSYLGAGTSIPLLDLNNMIGGALSRQAGDFLLVGAHRNQSGSSTFPALPSGYLDVVDVDTALGTISACRMAGKPLDGSENPLISLITTGSGLTTRLTYWAVSLACVGDPQLIIAPLSPFAEASPNRPASQIIPGVGESDPILYISAAAANNGDPNQTFVGATPVFNQLFEITGTSINHRVRLMYHILPSSPVNITTRPEDQGQNSFMTAGFALRVPSP